MKAMTGDCRTPKLVRGPLSSTSAEITSILMATAKIVHLVTISFSSMWPCLRAPNSVVPLGSLLSPSGGSWSGALQHSRWISFFQHWAARLFWTGQCPLTLTPSVSTPLLHTSTDEQRCPSSRACGGASGCSYIPCRVHHLVLGLRLILPSWLLLVEGESWCWWTDPDLTAAQILFPGYITEGRSQL